MWMKIMKSIWKHKNNVILKNLVTDGKEIFGITVGIEYRLKK